MNMSEEGFMKIDKKLTFNFSSTASKMMNLKDKDGIMFSLCRRENCVFCYKEKEESYQVCKDGSFMRVWNKPSAELILRFFGLKECDAHYFSIRQSGKRFRLVPKSE